MTAVSLGIIVLSFLIPIVIIPAVLGVSSASDCAISSGCAQDTYSKCGAYQSSAGSTSFTDSLGRGMKGMLCMMGLGGGEAKFIIWAGSNSLDVTLNKIPNNIR